MVLLGVLVQWIVHGYGSCISAPDSAWFWEGFQCSG